MLVNTKYKIIIVDDHQLFADGLKHILESNDNFEIIGICKSGKEFFSFMNNHNPDLVIMDIQMNGMTGIEVCEKLKQHQPKIKVVMLSMFDSKKVITDCKQVGANGYIHKSTDAIDVISTLLEILKGNDVFQKAVVNTNAIETTYNINKHALLSNREKEIIALIKSGNTSKQISTELFLSEYTIETHRKNILKKLGLKSVSELIAFAHMYL